MKKPIYLAIALALAVWFSFPARALGLSPGAAAPTVSRSTPGVELAQTISLITGVAISPLLGTGAVGAWKYFQAANARERARLPWFAQPWFWGPALLIVTLCFLKDTVGIAAPKVLKKPFDAAEVIEHKVSGLIATGAFVPLMVRMMEKSSSSPAEMMAANGFLASVDATTLANFVFIPAMMLVFFVVCIASSAINILILLSPFRIVDLALKAFRAALLSVVTLSALANPWLGAFVALLVVVAAFLIAGWSFRLSHFGLVFIWDFVSRRCNRFVPDPAVNRVFLSRSASRAPARSYGSLSVNEKGELTLRYRPWLILPKRELVFPAGTYVVAKGLFYSEIARVEQGSLKPAILLPPRYRSHEEQLAAIYGLAGVREAGLRAAFLWFRELVGFKGTQPLPAPAPAPA
jgi:hypothetical protein